MKYNKIRKMDISDGPGVRVSIFVQGCVFNCEGCFNPETHDFNGGQDFTDDKLNTIIDCMKPEYIRGLSVLGGEPMHPKNVSVVAKIIEKVKEVYPNKDIWVWSGFYLEDLLKRNDKDTMKVLNNIDVLVDGQFHIKEINNTLKYCGSENQRVINVQDSLSKKKIVLYKDR